MIRSILNNPYSLSAIRFYFRWIFRALCVVPQLAAATAEALLRRNFGARYIPTLAAGWGLLFFCALLAEARAPFFLLFSLLVGIRTAGHAMGAMRERDATRRHSRSSGEPLRIWAVVGRSTDFARSIAEPAFCLLSGMGAAFIDPLLSIWLTTAAAGLIIKDASARLRLHRRMSDAIDARIEAEQFGEAVQRRLRSRGAQSDQPHRARIASINRARRTPRL